MERPAVGSDRDTNAQPEGGPSGHTTEFVDRLIGMTPDPAAGAAALTFNVIGTPKPQGSKKAFVVGGKARMKESSGGHAAWRNQVAEAAYNASLGMPALDGPLRLLVTFRFPMPKSRPKKVRALGTVLKTTAPDTSKLVRCVEDALQAAGAIADDARIAELRAVKVETVEWTGAEIAVEAL